MFCIREVVNDFSVDSSMCILVVLFEVLALDYGEKSFRILFEMLP